MSSYADPNIDCIKDSIPEVSEAIAEGLKAARAKGVICGPATDVVIEVEDLICGSTPKGSLKRVTLSSIDAPERAKRRT
jgi:hypothetical protein